MAAVWWDAQRLREAEEGRVVFWNREQDRIFGGAPEPFALNEFRDVHPEDRVRFEEFCDGMLSGDGPAQAAELRLYPCGKSPGGTGTRWVHGRASSIEYGGGSRVISYTIHVVDDENTIREGIRSAFASKYRVEVFGDAESAIAALLPDPPDLVLLDLGLPGMHGLEAIGEFRRLAPEVLVIVITAYEDVASVVAAMKNGAFDYVVKPLHMDTLEVSIRNALETIRLKKEVRSLQERYLRENIPCFVGESHAIQDVMEFVRVLANSPDTPVLIVGETGTGKELIASAVHYWSPNSAGPIVSVNCAAIPRELLESELFGYEKGAFTGAAPAGKKGLVEQASGGTLFLDEVGDLSLEAQAKLLRFLEEGEFYRVGGTRKLKVRARVVSATNKDLPSLIAKNVFREDLYYRLAVVKVAVPSLEERREDIVPIAQYFLVEFGKKFGKSFSGFSPEARAALEGHRWRGNVRELRNVIERAALVAKEAELSRRSLGFGEPDGLGPKPEPQAFPAIPPEGMDLDAFWRKAEKHFIDEALRLSGGNETKAAQLLNINHHTFRYRRRKLSGVNSESESSSAESKKL